MVGQRITFKVIAEADAKKEWNEAVDWYEASERGVGLRFDDALRTILQRLATDPERYPQATRLTHRGKLPGPWPYNVYFSINREHREVKVLAIWHGSRNPTELRRRLK